MTHDAPSVSLLLDHVKVECNEAGAVVVKCYDEATKSLSIWVMKRTSTGWSLDASSLPFDLMSNISVH